MSIIYIFSFLVDRPQFYKPISVLDLCLSLSYRFTCCLVSLKIGPCSSPFCFSGNCSFLTCIIWFIIHVFTFYALQLKVFIFALLCKEILAFVWCYRTIDFMFGYNLVTIWEFFSFMRKMLFSFSITFFLGGGGGNEWSPVLSILGVFPNSIMKLICFAEMGSGIIEEKARFSCRIFVLLWLLIAPEKRVLKRAIFYWMRAIGRNLRILLCIVRTEEKVSNICLPFGEYNEQ